MGSNTLESRDAEENAQQFEKKKNKNKQRYYQSRDNTYTRHNSWVSTSVGCQKKGRRDLIFRFIVFYYFVIF